MAHLGNVIRCDVAEWISQLLDVRVEPDELVDALEDGVLLVKLANRLLEKGGGTASFEAYRVEKGHPKARKNVAQFLATCTDTFGVPASRLFHPDELLGRSNDVRVIQALHDLGRAQQVAPGPRSIAIGLAFDAETMADPEPEENQLLQRLMATVLADLGYNYEAYPINQVQGSWQYTFGQVGPVPIYFIHGDVIVRFEARWFTLARFLRQHGMLGQGRQVTDTPTSSPRQQSFAAVSPYEATYMDPFQTSAFMAPTPTRSPPMSASRAVDTDLGDPSYYGGIGLQPTSGTTGGSLLTSQRSPAVMSPQLSPQRSPPQPSPAVPAGGSGAVELLELQRKLDVANHRIRDAQDETARLKYQLNEMEQRDAEMAADLRNGSAVLKQTRAKLAEVIREAADNMEQREVETTAKIREGAAALEQTRAKLAEVTSDNYEEKFQQQLHATHAEHREAAEKREGVLHGRLQEHQYFSDLKDADRDLQYKALLETEIEAALKRRQAEHHKELAARRADENARLNQVEAAYAATQAKMTLTIQQLRKQLRDLGGDGVPGVSSSTHISSRINVSMHGSTVREDDEGRPRPNLDQLTREEHAKSLQDLNKKLRAAKGETKDALVLATKDKENMVLSHDAAVDALERTVHDLREQLQAAKAAGRKALLELKTELQKENAIEVAGLKAKLADKMTGQDVATAAAMAAAAAADNAVQSALREAQGHAAELASENARLELQLKQQAAEHARHDRDELEKLRAVTDKAISDLTYDHAEKEAQLKQENSQAKLDILNVREQSSKALASQKLVNDEAQRSLKHEALDEQRRLREELAAEHEAALANLKKIQTDATRAADTANAASIEELRGKIREQLAALHKAESEASNRQAQLQAEKLARSDLESKLAAEAASTKHRNQALDETQRTVSQLAGQLADAQDQLLRDAKTAADRHRALQDEHAQTQRKLRHDHQRATEAAQTEHDKVLADREAVRKAEQEHANTEWKGQQAIKDQQLQDMQDELDSQSRANNTAMQAAAKAAKDELAALGAKLNAECDGRVSVLQAALDKANTEIGVLQQKIARLLERIAELEAQLVTENEANGRLTTELESAKATLERQSAKAAEEKAAQAAQIAKLDLVASSMKVARDAAVTQMNENTERQKEALQAAKDEVEKFRAVAESKERDALAATKVRDEEETLREEAERLRGVAETALQDALRAAEDAEKTARDSLQQKQHDADLELAREREAADNLAAVEAAWRNNQADKNRLASLKATDQLAPFRQDICKWINNMIHPKVPLRPDTLLRDLASGTKLLDLAAAIDTQEVKTRDREHLAAKAGWGDKKLAASPAARKQKPKASPSPKPKLNRPVHMPPAKTGTKAADAKAYRPDDAHSDKALADMIRNRPLIKLHPHSNAAFGTAEATHNVQEFVRWARGLGLEQPDIFNEDDLLLHKSERHVLFGLYDVARRCRDKVPDYVVFERAHYHPRHRNNLKKGDPVDIAVDEILRECICNPRVELTKTGDEKNKNGHEKYVLSGLESNNPDKPVCLMVKNSNVVIRIGGGWANFKQHLEEHDKCRKNKPLKLAHQQFFKLQQDLKGNKKFTKDGQAHIALFTNRPKKTTTTPKKTTTVAAP